VHSDWLKIHVLSRVSQARSFSRFVLRDETETVNWKRAFLTIWKTERERERESYLHTEFTSVNTNCFKKSLVILKLYYSYYPIKTAEHKLEDSETVNWRKWRFHNSFQNSFRFNLNTTSQNQIYSYCRRLNTSGIWVLLQRVQLRQFVLSCFVSYSIAW